MENKETGEQIEDNDFFRMQLRKLNQPISRCQHCFCGSGFFNNQEHLICCMCGHRQLKNPITF